MPIERAASFCVLSTDIIAPRNVSEQYAPTFKEKVIIAATQALN